MCAHWNGLAGENTNLTVCPGIALSYSPSVKWKSLKKTKVVHYITVTLAELIHHKIRLLHLTHYEWFD